MPTLLWAYKTGSSQIPDPKVVLWSSPCLSPAMQGLGSSWMTLRGSQGGLENQESAIGLGGRGFELITQDEWLPYIAHLHLLVEC